MKVLNIKKATPMFSGVITTCSRYNEEESSHGTIIDSTKLNQIKDIQEIVSLSEQAKARGLSVGDTLSISFERYKKSKQVKKKNSIMGDIDEHYEKQDYYDLPTLLLDNREHLLIDVADITLKIDEFEYITEGEGLISGEKIPDFSQPKTTLIL